MSHRPTAKHIMFQYEIISFLCYFVFQLERKRNVVIEPCFCHCIVTYFFYLYVVDAIRKHICHGFLKDWYNCMNNWYWSDYKRLFCFLNLAINLKHFFNVSLLNWNDCNRNLIYTYLNFINSCMFVMRTYNYNVDETDICKSDCPCHHQTMEGSFGWYAMAT